MWLEEKAKGHDRPLKRLKHRRIVAWPSGMDREDAPRMSHNGDDGIRLQGQEGKDLPWPKRLKAWEEKGTRIQARQIVALGPAFSHPSVEQAGGHE